MRRRQLHDPLKPVQESTWLVVRNMCRQPLDWRRLRPGVDLRAILNYTRDQRVAARWACTEIGRANSGFFAERAGDRVQMGIERFDPDGPGAPMHCDPAPK